MSNIFSTRGPATRLGGCTFCGSLAEILALRSQRYASFEVRFCPQCADEFRRSTDLIMHARKA